MFAAYVSTSFCYADTKYMEILTLSTRGWDAKEAPASRPKPVTTFNTPGGRPTSRHMPANSKQVLNNENPVPGK